jgi:hypothetical protein
MGCRLGNWELGDEDMVLMRSMCIVNGFGAKNRRCELQRLYHAACQISGRLDTLPIRKADGSVDCSPNSSEDMGQVHEMEATKWVAIWWR